MGNEEKISFSPKSIGILVLCLFGLGVLFASCGTIGAGQRGVLTTFGAVSQGVRGEGLYFKLPLIQGMTKLDVRLQKEQVEVEAASKDLQQVKSTVAVNFSLSPDRVARVFQEVGSDYKIRLLDPAIQEVIKATTAKFTAEELITKREEVRTLTCSLLKERLADKGIIITDLNVINFDFSKSFNEAIEAKVTAEQNALAAKNKLEQVKFESEQKIAEAKGKAEAIRVEANAISSNPQILRLRAIEKWNGDLPQIVGSNVMPFIGNMSLTGSEK